jgi:tetratricopeptide (TPR) repeat protein
VPQAGQNQDWHAARALVQVSDDPDLSVELAWAQMQVDIAAAQVSFEDVLAAHPQLGRGWLGLGLTKLQRSRVQDAITDLQRAAQCLPDHIGTWHALAWTHLLQGDAIASRAIFERALALNRNFAETHGGLAAVAALQGRTKDAHASIRRALKLDSQTMSVRYARIVLLQRAGRHREAQAVLDDVLDRPAPDGGAPLRDRVVAQHLRLAVCGGNGPTPGVSL